MMKFGAIFFNEMGGRSIYLRYEKGRTLLLRLFVIFTLLPAESSMSFFKSR